ncbi:carotenoid cleavage dioxygenase, putative [Paecilomyces variotii No. 5]|uniref:Carotenoid cleavage dioxygenase, putative n=1 Tax=Byssochlamys spectabilis (strain No. 5 / NBRC 109023) TaxID=1356009 RepID=V5FJS7_BYSSN|nr:carotenoid cleavage dioxygenase, putative [Paecilomyces variotii No. 5]
MAHIFELAEALSSQPAYVDGVKCDDRIKYPATEVFQGFNRPSRIEGDVEYLEVTGVIPDDIDGTFFRIQPDHRFPPLYESDIHFNGDGNVTAIRVQNGVASFKQRYVHTDRYVQESKHGKALFGKYRNPYTDNEAVKGVIRTTANTNIFFWRGMLLATKEDGPPYAMDPETLETIGRYDFEGQVLAPTFTAHPKFDLKTGEMVCYGYEAGGNGNDGSNDIVVYTINSEGVKTEECWYKAPFCGIIHDCGITDNWVVLPMTPLKCDPDRLAKGENHWAWDPKEDQWYGIVPRRGGKPEDIKWFRSKNAFQGHTVSSYETEDEKIVFDLTIADGNVFFFFPPVDTPQGTVLQRNKLQNKTTRWVFDPKAPSNSWVDPAEEVDTFSGEFSRVDDRFVTTKYNHYWQAVIDGLKPYDFQRCGSPAGGLFNTLGHFTWDRSVMETFWAGPCQTFQEPAFIPRAGSTEEGDGYIIALLNHLDVLRNDVCIFDAQKISQGPVAVIHLPFKLRLGLHGNFVEMREIKDWKEKRERELGPVKPASAPLPWQQKEGASQPNGLNGHH